MFANTLFKDSSYNVAACHFDISLQNLVTVSCVKYKLVIVVDYNLGVEDA